MFRFWYRRYFFDCFIQYFGTFFVMDFERKNGKFFISEHNFRVEDDH